MSILHIYLIMAPNPLNSRIKHVFSEGLSDWTDGSKNKFNNNDKKEKNQLPYYACSLLIICFIGPIFVVAVAFTSSRSYSSDAS